MQFWIPEGRLLQRDMPAEGKDENKGQNKDEVEEEEEEEREAVEKCELQNIQIKPEEEEEALILKTINQQKVQQDPNQSYGLIASLKACSQEKDLHRGQQIHADAIRLGLLQNNVYLGSTLVSMYAKCGSVAKAQEVFDKLTVRNVVTWNALIAGYAEHGHAQQALQCYGRMQQDGISPSAVTYICTLQACGSLKALDKGKELHAEIAGKRLLEKKLALGNALVDMYAKCGSLQKAQEVFDKFPIRNVISWTTIIAGFTLHGHGEQALKCFEKMKLEGVSPNAVTYVCILQACGLTGAADKGKALHAETERKGLLKKNIVVGTALVDMYAKCGLLAEAQEVFDELSLRDVILWNVLVAGYVQHGHGEQALKCYKRMQLEGFSPNAATFVCILKACGNIGAVDKGKEIHAEIVRKGLLRENAIVGRALVDMYAKCGLLAKAHEVFDKLPVPGVVAWSSLMDGYAVLGKAEDVFYLFDKMIEEGEKPDLITFAIVLNVCSHAGLLEKGQMYFESMSRDYGIGPNLEHHTCMVDLFARAGHLEKAVALIQEMPFCADLKTWVIVLAACRKWGNMKFGRLAFEHAIQLDEKDAAVYVCMSNIYANAGRQEEADKVEAMRVRVNAQAKLEHRWLT